MKLSDLTEEQKLFKWKRLKSFDEMKNGLIFLYYGGGSTYSMAYRDLDEKFKEIYKWHKTGEKVGLNGATTNINRWFIGERKRAKQCII